jgi:beta-galactosidase
LRYGNSGSGGWLNGQPAAITRRVGKGRMTYIGVVMDPSLMEGLAKWMIENAEIHPTILQVPENVEVCRRSGVGKDVLILINHGRGDTDVRLPKAMLNVLDGGRETAVRLGAHGVAVMRDNGP